MKGNSGLNLKTIVTEINDKEMKLHFGSKLLFDNKDIYHSDLSYKKYTNILPHKQLYEPIITEENDTICYKFILTTTTEKFLVLKELYLMADDLTVDEFYPSIKRITHHVNNESILNDLDGLSLRVINLFGKSNNKYSLEIPIISSYGVMLFLQIKQIEIKIFTTSKMPLKLLASFNHLTEMGELQKFVQQSIHQHLNTSFILNKFNVKCGSNSFVLENDSTVESCYKSLILIVDKNHKKINATIHADNFVAKLNLIDFKHKIIGDKIAFLITNFNNTCDETIYYYKPSGHIKSSNITIQIESSCEHEISIVSQQYNLIKCGNIIQIDSSSEYEIPIVSEQYNLMKFS